MTSAFALVEPGFSISRSRTPALMDSGLTPTSAEPEAHLGTTSEPLWVSSTLAQLSHLVSLPVGWDGYDGRPVSRVIAIRIVRFLSAIAPAGLPAPTILPIYEGAQLEWEAFGIRIEVEIADSTPWVEIVDESVVEAGGLDQLLERFRWALGRIARLACRDLRAGTGKCTAVPPRAATLHPRLWRRLRAGFECGLQTVSRYVRFAWG